MLNKFELVEKAINASGFQTTAASADYINPEIWNKMLLEHTESQLVIAKLARQYNDLLNRPGDVLDVSVDAEPIAATALVESDDVGITALTFTQVQFTPTEYGAAYQLSDKQARRSFFDLMQNIVKKLGYRMALKRESLAITLLLAGAAGAVTANNVTASDIVSSDTLDEVDIINARKTIKVAKYVPTTLIIGITQEAQLLASDVFNDASKYGSRDAILGGLIGRAFGIDIYWSDLLGSNGTIAGSARSIMLGVSKSGEEAFGVCNKKTPSVETERHALGRYTDFVGVEEYQFKVLHSGAICTIESYE